MTPNKEFALIFAMGFITGVMAEPQLHALTYSPYPERVQTYSHGRLDTPIILASGGGYDVGSDHGGDYDVGSDHGNDDKPKTPESDPNQKGFSYDYSFPTETGKYYDTSTPNHPERDINKGALPDPGFTDYHKPTGWGDSSFHDSYVSCARRDKDACPSDHQGGENGASH